jgi:hypothetical protein
MAARVGVGLELLGGPVELICEGSAAAQEAVEFGADIGGLHLARVHTGMNSALAVVTNPRAREPVRYHARAGALKLSYDGMGVWVAAGNRLRALVQRPVQAAR